RPGLPPLPSRRPPDLPRRHARAIVKQQWSSHPQAGAAVVIPVVQQYCEFWQPCPGCVGGSPVLKLLWCRTSVDQKATAFFALLDGLGNGIALGGTVKLPVSQRHAGCCHDGEQYKCSDKSFA